jgi:hypothetical protein
VSIGLAVSIHHRLSAVKPEGRKEGETAEEFLKNVADHVIQKHGMRAEDIIMDNIPVTILLTRLSVIEP